MTLSRRGRYLVLASAFLGWMFAGVEMSLMIPATRPAIQEFLQPEGAPASAAAAARIEILADQWLSAFITAFLLGAAAGGALFGWIGDRAGRVHALALSVLCYSTFTGIAYFAGSPWQLFALRFVASLGIGGMWPAGVTLVSEAWPRLL